MVKRIKLIIYFIVALLVAGCSSGYKQALVKTRTVIHGNTTCVPLLVDLIIDDSRVSGTFSCKSYFGIEYAKTQAVAVVLKKENADVLFEPQYLIENTGSLCNVEVSGHPAHYKNFHQPVMELQSYNSATLNKAQVETSLDINTTVPKPTISENVSVINSAPQIDNKKTSPVTIPSSATNNSESNNNPQSQKLEVKMTSVTNDNTKIEQTTIITNSAGTDNQKTNPVTPLPAANNSENNNNPEPTQVPVNKTSANYDATIVESEASKKSTELKAGLAEHPANKTQKDSKKIYHVVEHGETLYHISVMYKITVQQLKEWNKLRDNSIEVGQKLIVGE